MGENAAVLVAGQHTLALTISADLIVHANENSGLHEIARYQVAQSPTWATPAIVGDRIVIKDRDNLILWEVPK